MSQQDEFVREFLVESREGLEQLDNDLVALEENPSGTARLDSAFRSLHTIKGNSGFLAFHRLGEIAHAGEALLQRLRSGEIRLNSKITDALLDAVDAIRQMLQTIEQTGGEGDERFEALESRLNQLAEEDNDWAEDSKSDEPAEAKAEGSGSAIPLPAVVPGVQEAVEMPQTALAPKANRAEVKETFDKEPREEQEEATPVSR
ncbi:MAG: hypothetical protein CMJ78_06510 [Planctomycetaceae bacterium]|nr:hypothetical protein [Planctomycetaceae bacterium]